MERLNQPLSALVRFGVSDHLLQDLRALEESTDINESPLYSHVAMYELRCAILCRSYGKTLWEYSHFVAVLEHLSASGVIDLFWGKQVVSAAHLKAWVGTLPALDWLRVEAQGGLKVQIGKREFVLNPGRINLMAAWTAFIAIADPMILAQFAQFRDGLSEAKIDAFARHVKARLDQYLEPHLQALHQQRQGRVMLSWLLSEQSGATRLEPEASVATLLEDQAVLNFWVHAAQTDDGDFKRFATVAECAYRLFQAITLDANRREIDTARSVDQDDSGDDASWLLDEVSQVQNGESLFDAMVGAFEPQATWALQQGSLAAIKFLSKRDLEFCATFEQPGAALWHLPLTFIRAQVFGLQQARISEDLRQTKGENLAGLVSLQTFEGYSPWQLLVSEQVLKIEETRAAIAHILLHFQHPAALVRLLERLDADSRAQCQAWLGADPARAGVEPQMAEKIMQLSPASVQQFKAAFERINRQGFSILPAAEALDAYIQGDQLLTVLAQTLRRYQLSLQVALASSEIAQRDQDIFKTMFMQLYCGSGVPEP